MNPQRTAVAPAPTTVNPQGVASVAPNAAPTAPALPQPQAPVGTPAQVQQPNFNTSQTLQDIANYYQIPRQAAQVTGAGQSTGNVAGQQFEAQKAQNEIKIQNQQNSLNPSTYQFTKNADGSVTILNSVGDKVDIGQFAALTGANPAQALQQAGATDQASQKFIAAYNNLQTYVQDKIAAQQGDVQAQAAVDDFYKQNPGLENIQLGALQTAFMQQYGQYFGQPQGNQGALSQAGVNPTITSQNNPVSSSAYENPNYQASFQANQYQPQGSGYGTTGSGGSTASELAALQAQATNNNTGL
jgi:hypothetical protein